MKIKRLSLVLMSVLAAAILVFALSCGDDGGGGGDDGDGGGGGDVDGGGEEVTITPLVVDAAPVSGSGTEYGEYVRYSLSVSGGNAYTVVLTPVTYPAEGASGFMSICTSSDCTSETSDAINLEGYGSSALGQTLYPASDTTYYISVMIVDYDYAFTIQAVKVDATALTLGADPVADSVSAGEDVMWSFTAEADTTYVVTVEPTGSQFDVYVGNIGFPEMSTVGLAADVSTTTVEIVCRIYEAGTYYISIHGDTDSTFNLSVATGGELTLDLTGVDGDKFFYYLFDQDGVNIAYAFSSIDEVYTREGDVFSGTFYLYIKVDLDSEGGFHFDAGEPGYFDEITITEDTTLILTNSDMVDAVEEAVTVEGETDIPDGSALYCYWYVDPDHPIPPDSYGITSSRANTDVYFSGGSVTTDTNEAIIPSDEFTYSLYCVADVNDDFGSEENLAEPGEDYIAVEDGIVVTGEGTTVTEPFELLEE